MQVLHVTYNIELLQAIRRGVGDNMFSRDDNTYSPIVDYIIHRLARLYIIVVQYHTS